MIKIEGIIDTVIFYNSDNGYAVCDVSCVGELVTMTGTMPNITEGEKIIASGEWTTHVDYGDQFKVEYIERVMPSSENEIEKYLASGILPYVGKMTAKKIVEKFGTDALDVIENDHEKLLEIKGLTKSKIEDIYKAFVEQIGIRQIVMFFQKYNVSPSSAVKVFKIFGTGTIPLVQNNPYILADQIDGITFEKADEIAMSLGFETKSYVRIASGIKSIIKRISFLNGHTYLPRPTIIAQAVSMLEVEQGPVEDAISQLLLSGELISENQGDYDAIYLKLFYDAEREVAEKLIRMSGVTFDIDISQIDGLIDKVESEDRIELSENQREAVRRAFQTAALVITGGPGTGKTTIINTIINAMKIEHNKVMLAAPTGRAAKRMSEVCGFEAKTIHRILEITPGVDEVGSCFARNSENPLDCDVLIIDEMSMVDIILMKHLTDALSSRTRLIMVGDSDQLPSVGAGNVLKDIIDSHSIECIKLTEIFRQAKESMIVVNAHRVNNGEEPLLNDNDNDFFFVHRDDPMQLPNTIADLCVRRLPQYYGLDGITQIQVLTPTRKSLIGVQNLNTILQSCLNPPSPDKREYITRRCIFRVGDKVMQIKNNYQLEWKRDTEKGLGVFNGDVGFIIDIDSRAQKMTVQFDDKIVVYDFLLLDEIELAYAITVHKSQGSEFDAVVMPMFETHRLLMTRNLFYTAITRAKSLVVLVGQEGVMAQYVNNDNVQRRFSGLKDKLKIF